MIPRKEEIPTPSFPLFLHGFGIMLFSGDDGWGNGGVSGVYFFRLSPSSFLSLLQQPLEIIFHFLCHHSPPFRLSVVVGSMVTLFDCFQILFCGRYTEEERCKMFYCHLDRECIYQISFEKGTQKMEQHIQRFPTKKKRRIRNYGLQSLSALFFFGEGFFGCNSGSCVGGRNPDISLGFRGLFWKTTFLRRDFFFRVSRAEKKEKIDGGTWKFYSQLFSPPQKNNISARKHGQLWLLFSKTNAQAQSCLFWVYPGKK